MGYTSREVQIRPNYDPQVFVAIALAGQQHNDSFEAIYWNMILQIARIH
jgi:hypothetical protein